MKKFRTTPLFYKAIFIFSLTFIYNCSGDDSDDNEPAQTLSQSDKDALLFMLEEEKLARDTYTFLDITWGITQFSNIKNSEQSHMNTVVNLLNRYNISYNILPAGEFENQDLQNLYNKFVIDGANSSTNAIKIGATIEDLDIVDLQTNIDATTNQSIISVFNSLQCGSRNHLKSFVFALESTNETYTPQFLSQDDYNSIIVSSHEKCGLQQ